MFPSIPVRVEEELVEHLHPLLPGDPEVPPGEEAGDGVPGQVVDPSLLPQLGHDGVDPGEPGAAVGPLGEGLCGVKDKIIVD